MDSLKKILEGWKNDIFPATEMKELIRETQAQRLAVCLNCPFNSSETRVYLNPSSLTPSTP